MPNRGGLYEPSSIVLPEGGMEEGLFGKNRNVSAAYQSDEVEAAFKANLPQSMIDSNILLK